MAKVFRVPGYTIVHSPSIGIKYRTKRVKRSLRERFFSLPWHPLDRYKIVVERYIDKAMFYIPRTNVIYVNTALVPKLLKEIGKARNGMEEIIEYL